jgi:hypothetical protein
MDWIRVDITALLSAELGVVEATDFFSYVRKLKAVDMQEQIASKEFTNVKFADT